MFRKIILLLVVLTVASCKAKKDAPPKEDPKKTEKPFKTSSDNTKKDTTKKKNKKTAEAPVIIPDSALTKRLKREISAAMAKRAIPAMSIACPDARSIPKNGSDFGYEVITIDAPYYGIAIKFAYKNVRVNQKDPAYLTNVNQAILSMYTYIERMGLAYGEGVGAVINLDSWIVHTITVRAR